jgi:cellulose synthase/poly-beta-1,6-N-acetylglucosamine synthase-like glycosyltransferase
LCFVSIPALPFLFVFGFRSLPLRTRNVREKEHLNLKGSRRDAPSPLCRYIFTFPCSFMQSFFFLLVFTFLIFSFFSCVFFVALSLTLAFSVFLHVFFFSLFFLAVNHQPPLSSRVCCLLFSPFARRIVAASAIRLNKRSVMCTQTVALMFAVSTPANHSCKKNTRIAQLATEMEAPEGRYNLLLFLFC